MAFNKAKTVQEAQKYVAQGKTALAIRQYLSILENDPSDLILLNTIGDLYVRENNITEGLGCFGKLAEAYAREGFTVKAVAIYKKISKIDQNNVEPFLKMAELYQAKGLVREAREAYTKAFDLYEKAKQKDEALEALRKLSLVAPNNPGSLLKLAQYAETVGNINEAANAYLKAANAAQQWGNAPVAESAWSKATALAPRSPAVQLHRAQEALKDRPAEVAQILASNPELQADSSARHLLFESYLATHNLDAAGKLLHDIFQSDPADFTPVASFVTQCIASQDYDRAYETLRTIAPHAIERRKTEAMMEALRNIWQAAPQHIDTLKLIYQVAEKTADEATIPEVLEALGHAFVQDGENEKAEEIYTKLLAREPENQTYRDMLKEVLQKQGKEYAVPEVPVLAITDLDLAAESEIPPSAADLPSLDSEESAKVKAAFENSDLFVRYNLTEKALAELEKVLDEYPDQVTIHERIIETCRKNVPGRSAQAAETLARIFSERGESTKAKRYQEEAIELAAAASSMEEFPFPIPGAENQPNPSEQIEPTLGAPTGEAEEEWLPSAQEIPLEFETRQEQPSPHDLASITSPEIGEASEAPSDVAKPVKNGERTTSFNYAEAREEIQFYLAHGLNEEAHQVINSLEQKYPEESQVADLRRHVDEFKQESTSAAELDSDQEWELPTAFPIAAQPAEENLTASVWEADRGDAPADLADELASIPKGLPVPEQEHSFDASGNLGSLLEELTEDESSSRSDDNDQTHYNLGVAFREMGLLDEAIGEFQKVLKNAAHEHFPPNFLQGCTLLATCFMDKGMPAIAAKWYLRALELPDLDREAVLALQYDLGIAYEKAGNIKAAIEKFTEVYSQNIDYRDVAEKIRFLGREPS